MPNVPILDRDISLIAVVYAAITYPPDDHVCSADCAGFRDLDDARANRQRGPLSDCAVRALLDMPVNVCQGISAVGIVWPLLLALTGCKLRHLYCRTRA